MHNIESVRLMSNKENHIGKMETFVKEQIKRMTEKFDCEEFLLIVEGTWEEEEDKKKTKML